MLGWTKRFGVVLENPSFVVVVRGGKTGGDGGMVSGEVGGALGYGSL